MSNPIGNVSHSLSAPSTPAYSPAHVAKVEQDDFEKSLETPMTDKEKKEWDGFYKQFDLSIFQMEHTRSMAHTDQMKKIWSDLDDAGKTKPKTRRS